MRHLSRLSVLLVLATALAGAVPYSAQAQASLPPAEVLTASDSDISVGPVVDVLIRFGAQLAPDDGLRQDSNGELVPHTGWYGTPEREGMFKYLRDWLRSFAMLLLMPIAFINLIVTVIRTKSGLESELGALVVHLFLVTLLMQGYWAWDKVIWYGVTIPAVKVFQSGEIVDEMISRAVRGGSEDRNLPGTQTDDYRTSTHNDDILSRSASLYQGTLACGVGSEKDPQDPATRRACGDENTPPEVRAARVRMLNGINNDNMGFTEIPDDLRSNSDVADAESNQVIWLGALWNAIWNPIDSIAGWIRNKMVNFSAKIMETWVGMVVGLQHLIVLVIMWFIWIGSIFTRAMSLTLAPLQFAFSLLPGGRDRIMKWFQWHTKMILAPAAYSFGFLCFYALQISILTTDAFGNGLIGLGMQIAMSVLFIVICWKMKDALTSVGTDITQAAGAVGKFVQDKAVDGVKAVYSKTMQTAGKTMQIAGTVAGAAAGGAFGGPSGAIAGSAVSPKSGAGEDTAKTFDRMNGGDGLSTTLDPNYQPKTKPAHERSSSVFDRMKNIDVRAGANAAFGALRDSGKEAGKSFLENNAVTGPFAQSFKKAWEGSKSADDPKRMVAAVDKESVERATLRGDIVEYLREVAEEEGRTFELPTAKDFRHMDRLPVDFDVKAASQQELDDIMRLYKAAGYAPVWLTSVTVNGVTTLEMNEESREALAERFLEDPEFAKLVSTEAAAAGVEMHPGPNGVEIPDFQQLAKRSTLFAKFLMAKAMETEDLEQAWEKQSLLIENGNRGPGSLGEYAIRRIPREIYKHELTKETAAERELLLRYSDAALRIAYAIVHDMPIDDLRAIVSNPEIGNKVNFAGWNSPDSFDKVKSDPKIVAAVDKAAEILAESFGADVMPEGPQIQYRHNKFGLDIAQYKATFGEIRYRGHQDSIFERELGKIQRDNALGARFDLKEEHHAEAFKRSFDKAAKQLATELRGRGVAVPEPTDKAAFDEWTKTVETDIHEIMFRPAGKDPTI